MSDENNLEPVTQTNADPAGAQAAGTQLENDIIKAKALSDAYSECEARLKSLRSTIAGPQANIAPEDILGWVMMGIEAAQRATRAVYPAPQSDKKPTLSPDENPSSGSNPKSASDAPVDLENQDRAKAPPADDAAPDVIFYPENQGDLKAPALRDMLPASGFYPDIDPLQNISNRPPDSSAGFARAAVDPSQSLQNSEDRVRAALEQNSQITISLLNRILGLIDTQNRKLSEVDLKTNELSSQIKSLKNP